MVGGPPLVTQEDIEHYYGLYDLHLLWVLDEPITYRNVQNGHAYARKHILPLFHTEAGAMEMRHRSAKYHEYLGGFPLYSIFFPFYISCDLDKNDPKQDILKEFYIFNEKEASEKDPEESAEDYRDDIILYSEALIDAMLLPYSPFYKPIL